MQRIGFIVYPGFNVLSLAALTVLEFVNRGTNAPAYGVEILSEVGGPVKSSIGVTVETARVTTSDYDTLIIGAGAEVATSRFYATRPRNVGALSPPVPARSS
jgi:transcriptional regulator GlxA family with amidase domain